MAKTASVNINDAVLVEQCRQGDSAATERLILKYQDRIYNIILRMCGNKDDAAELTQDTFVKVIENIDSFEGRSGFYTWLFRIAFNLTLNYCQRNAKITTKTIDIDAENKNQESRAGDTLKNILADENIPNPAIVAQNKELHQLVMNAIMKLDDSQRAVIVLRDIEGMDYAQIAKILGIELGTVKSRLSRGRSNLRDILKAIL